MRTLQLVKLQLNQVRREFATALCSPVRIRISTNWFPVVPLMPDMTSLIRASWKVAREEMGASRASVAATTMRRDMSALL
ncbi:MAG: hypothetical protein E6J77_20860 [Deltaproteobacteria bacterium]|nr:MAG: hypothetical protein E6J77_20860 [Deltaproteobacteria bacterium]